MSSMTNKHGENGSDTSSSGGDSSTSGNNSSSSSSTGSKTSNTSSGGQVPEPTQCGICKESYASGDAHTCDPNDPHAGYFA
ncbi:hypothetical protein M0657_010547 [Pyricularia oryzae]|uniref:Uncharacterized protein n=2 Tax=Pyricularia oryzae TaxID=318829 RepID=A0AA97NYG1_PYRO3|nr:hypothetical protein OOU_Y34scaffold00531g1 [Pyricularia oryzae Y34]KAI7912249.1 hypothetical protein M0657_010547 [Pyricularia oryzae]KAI7913652.1 hypothetical protein M9X92_009342 [Pyricularia oryzae]